MEIPTSAVTILLDGPGRTGRWLCVCVCVPPSIV